MFVLSLVALTSECRIRTDMSFVQTLRIPNIILTIMPIYTRTGDGGRTDMANGTRTAKASAYMEAIGTLDELNAHLGLALAECQRQFSANGILPLRDEMALVLSAQRFLLGIGAWAAGAREARHFPAETDVEALEKAIDRIVSECGPAFNGFVLPGGTVAAAQIHVARTVCRRAERNLLQAGASEWQNASYAMAYMNRLSDFFYALAKKINKLANVEEIKW